MLVRYTYYGDANLDGKVDGSDYSLIDNGYRDGLTGWYNGGFNYGITIDGSDYTLIDNAFNSQGAPIAQAQAAIAAASRPSRSVPANVFQASTPITFARPDGSDIEAMLLKKDVLDGLGAS